MNALDFRALVYSTYGDVTKTPLAVPHALAQLVREHHARLQRDEKTWYDLLALKTRSA